MVCKTVRIENAFVRFRYTRVADNYAIHNSESLAITLLRHLTNDLILLQFNVLHWTPKSFSTVLERVLQRKLAFIGQGTRVQAFTSTHQLSR